MLDRDLAELYGVETKRLKEQVKRNINRFPGDFMFEVTDKEEDFLRSQIATLESGRGKYSKYRSFAFTEQGVAMLSSVLKSERAIAVNIQIMRIFTRWRCLLANHEELKHKIEKMEKAYNKQFKTIFETMELLLEQLEDKSGKIEGFC